MNHYYLFYTLSLIQYYIILWLKLLHFWLLETLLVNSCVFLAYSYHRGFCLPSFALRHFLALWGTPRSSCVLTAPHLGTHHFSKELWFLLLENATRNQNLSSSYVWCCWIIDASGPHQRREQGNLCVFTHLDLYLWIFVIMVSILN